MSDVNRYRIICRDRFLFPDTLIDLIDGKNSSLIFDQKKKDPVLDRCQFDCFSIDSNFLTVISPPVS